MNAVTTAAAPLDQGTLRAQCDALLTETFNKTDMAREADIAYGTFTNWLNGTYAGKNEIVAAKVKLWLENRQQRTQVTKLNVTSPPYQPTPTSESVLVTCMYAQALKDFGVIVGPSGVGKTSGIGRYKDTNPNVWVVTVEPLLKTASGIMQEICHVMGVMETSTTRMPRSISRHIEDKNGLLIVDEAQLLNIPAIEQLRALNKDGKGLAIVLCGNESLLASLEGLSGFNSQIYSRVGGRNRLKGSQDRDIEMQIAAWDVTDTDETKFLRAIAAKDGHLRNIDKCMKRANVLAAGEGVPRTITHLRAAWANLAPAKS